MLRLCGVAVRLYVCWLAMLAVHESGHVLHALLSGGRVAAVDFPLLGFSRTDLAENPAPQFVAWGGPVWGCLLPIGIWLALTGWMRDRGDGNAVDIPGRTMSRAIERWGRFFAGFCLISNGAYLGVGGLGRVGDAGDLLGHGAAMWMLIAFGLVTVSAGLWMWHTLGTRIGMRRAG